VVRDSARRPRVYGQARPSRTVPPESAPTYSPRICNSPNRSHGTIATEDMGVPVLTGADGRLAMTEAIGHRTMGTRARFHNLSKTGDDSGRLQGTTSCTQGNELSSN
jgi:hypothetical protein